jgi:hypothetical protein
VNSREDIEESGFEDCEESEEEDSERLVPSSIEPVNKYLHEYSSVEVVSQNDDKSFITLNHSEGDGINNLLKSVNQQIKEEVKSNDTSSEDSGIVAAEDYSVEVSEENVEEKVDKILSKKSPKVFDLDNGLQ